MEGLGFKVDFQLRGGLADAAELSDFEVHVISECEEGEPHHHWGEGEDDGDAGDHLHEGLYHWVNKYSNDGKSIFNIWVCLTSRIGILILFYWMLNLV